MKHSTWMKISLLLLLIFISACDITEEKLDTGLVGIWHRVYKTIDGVPYGLSAIVYLNADGTGMSDENVEPGSEENIHFNFTWETTDSVITIKDENDSTVWTARYSLQQGQKVIKLSDITGERSDEELYVKYSGNKDVNLIGNWALANQTNNSDRVYTLQLTQLFADGAGETYAIAGYQVADLFDLKYVTTQNFETFDWSTTTDYLIIMPDQENQLSRVIQYSVANDQLDGTSINKKSETEKYRYIRDHGSLDEACLGTWNLSSVKVGDFSYSFPSEFTLELNVDSTGVWSYESKGGDFQWSANSGHIFIYVKHLDNFLNVSLVQTYQVDDQNLQLVLEEYRGDIWIRVEYTFTKAE